MIPVQKAITAENQYTDWTEVSGDVAISIWGTFAATVTLERRIDEDDNTKLTLGTYTTPIYDIGEEVEKLSAKKVEWRIGVATGDFTSGTCNVRLAS